MQEREIVNRIEDLGIKLEPRDLARLLRVRRGDSLYETFLNYGKDFFEKPTFLESSLILNLLQAKKIATDLIDDKGRLDTKKQQAWIEKLEDKDPRERWSALALRQINEKMLLSIHAPAERTLQRTSFASQLICETLGLPLSTPMSNALARRAALTAYIGDLRQQVGSCFATAPARLIRSDNPAAFFADIAALLSKGFLTRIINGIQVEVPASLAWGRGYVDTPFLINSEQKKVAYAFVFATKLPFLRIWHLVKKKQGVKTLRAILKQLALPEKVFDEALMLLRSLTSCPLAKVWEYTLASMSDVRLEFVHWNSFAALGLDPNMEGGLAAFLIAEAEEKLGGFKERIDELESDIQTSEQHLNSISIRAKNSTNESDFMHLKSAAHGESGRLARLKGEHSEVARRLQNLHASIEPLLKEIMEAFTHEFVEVFDPEIGEESTHAFIPDDRMAGFRLAYKHGRIDPATWTFISDGATWNHMLSLFFQQVQGRLSHAELLDALSNTDFLLLMNWIQLWLGDPDLIEKARIRCDKKNQGATPWSSPSGGTVHYLLSLYFERPLSQNEVTKKPDSAEELFSFLLETTFDLPLQTKEHLAKNPFSGLILLAPKHCCTFHPSYSGFFEGWRREQYPYTWVRDEVIVPAKMRLDSFRFDPFTSAFFIDRLRALISAPKAPSIPDNASPRELKELLLSEWRGNSHLGDIIDTALYSWLPIIRGGKLQEGVSAICSELGTTSKLPFKNVGQYICFTKGDLFDCVLLEKAFPLDQVEAAARRVGYSLGSSVLFADSNWTREYLSFVVSPTTRALEVWRTDFSGAFGTPMSQWNFSQNSWSVLRDLF